MVPTGSRSRGSETHWGALAGAVVCVLASGCIGNASLPLEVESAPEGDFLPGRGGDDPGAGAEVGCAWSAPQVVRLTNAEYSSSLINLFGAPADIAKDVPADTYVGGFDNHADALTVSVVQLKAYASAATRLADAVFASPARRDALIGCDVVAGKEVCLSAYVDRLGRLAFRRTLEPDERAALLALAAKISAAEDPYRPARILFEAVVQSPSFLYRFEAGLPDPQKPGVHRLTGDELASRLSFLLLGTSPDAALLSQAAAGTLDTADGVRTVAGTLLDQPLAHGALQRFAQQWLRLQQLDGVTRSTVVWPAWTAETPGQMREETSRLLEDFLWTEQRPFLELLTAPSTYVNGPLAQLYGVAGPSSATSWQKVTLPNPEIRQGILTHASILTMTAPTEITAPILRGKWVRDALLCDPPPPPPAGIPAADTLNPGETVRQRLERHRSDAACAGCHAMMDPVGFGLERYDSIGRYRTTDLAGRPLTGEGSVSGFDPPAFTGPAQLAQKLRQTPKTAQCVVTHLQRYAFNRTEVHGDQCVTQDLTQVFQDSGQSFRQLLLGLVSSDAYRYVGALP